MWNLDQSLLGQERFSRTLSQLSWVLKYKGAPVVYSADYSCDDCLQMVDENCMHEITDWLRVLLYTNKFFHILEQPTNWMAGLI